MYDELEADPDIHIPKVQEHLKSEFETTTKT